MKILYCIPALNNAGGMERVLTEKVNYLINLPKYEITIVTTEQKETGIRFKLDKRIRLIHLGIDFDSHFSSNVVKKYILHKKKIRLYKSNLIKIINELGIGICVSLCGKEIEFLSTLNVNCKKICEIHFAMNFRKQFLVSRRKGFFWKFLGEIRTLQLKEETKGLDKLIVLTKADLKKWEITHTNVIQIPNPNPFSNKLTAELLNKRVISVGKLDPQKGYDMLIDAWKLVVVKHPDWILAIFGEGQCESNLRQRIEALNLEEKIILFKNTRNIESEYLDSSLYVMSSRYEGLAMVLIEAMSYGLPIVSFDCEHGPREVINDGENGFLVTPDHIESLAEKVCVLIGDYNLRRKMSLNALECVKKYKKELIMKQWIDLFEQLK